VPSWEKRVCSFEFFSLTDWAADLCFWLLLGSGREAYVHIYGLGPLRGMGPQPSHSMPNP
jgi:hypothetical protein